MEKKVDIFLILCSKLLQVWKAISYQLFWIQLAQEAMKRGLFIEASGGCDRGQAGDMMMFSPPFIVTKEEIDEMVGLFDEVLSAVEKSIGL